MCVICYIPKESKGLTYKDIKLKEEYYAPPFYYFKLILTTQLNYNTINGGLRNGYI